MEAHGVARHLPPSNKTKRLDHWFAATEQYPELMKSSAPAMAMKRAELQRQQVAALLT
jgi:hypothetical protein